MAWQETNALTALAQHTHTYTHNAMLYIINGIASKVCSTVTQIL